MSECHTMKKLYSYTTGAQEWVCDDCGRHFLMQPEPFKRIVLTPGDEAIAHTGGMMSQAPTTAPAKPLSGYKLH